jgi:hypothetical protein
VPFTVKANDDPPGTALAGSSGSLTNGTGFAVPVPERPTACVPLPALSVIVIAPVLGPVVVGVKVALMVQLPLGATELLQLLA